MSNKTEEAPLKNRREKGIALVWTAAIFIVLLLFMGFTIDAAKYFMVANQLQNAADAAALAGAQLVAKDSTPYTYTRDGAYNIANANYYVGGNYVVIDENPSNDPCGDVVIGRYTNKFTPTTSEPNAVHVVARCTGVTNPPVSLSFGPIVGVNTANVTRSATAKVKIFSAGLLTLDTIHTGLAVKGNAYSLTVTGNGANVQINSTVDVGHDNVTADEVDVVGPGTDSGIWHYDQPVMPDPLGEIQPPPWSAANDLSPQELDNHGNPTGKRLPITTGHYGPGYYSAGIAGSSNLILDPGIYVLDGVGLTGTFTANNVMMYIKGTGSISLGGNQAITLTPMTTGDYAGISIYMDRSIKSPAANSQVSMTGTPDLSSITGTIYMPGIDLTLKGNPGLFGNQIIVNTLDIRGNVTLDIPYNGAFKVFIPYLVE